MTISITFAGICTHVWRDGSDPRVVLVNATESTIITGQPIGAHVPTLRIAAKDLANVSPVEWPGTGGAIMEWKLDGARIAINAKAGVQLDPSYDRCMPRLTTLTPAIGPLSRAAVEDENPRLAASYFDVTGGTLSAGAIKDDGAVFSLLVAETEGPPLLSIAAFGSEVPTLIPLRDGAELTIANLGRTERQDGHFDFYLHYALAEGLPKDPGIPATPAGCRVNYYSPTWPPGLTTVDAGCSNSAYP
jgi:hypothetical protein